MSKEVRPANARIDLQNFPAGKIMEGKWGKLYSRIFTLVTSGLLGSALLLTQGVVKADGGEELDPLEIPTSIPCPTGTVFWRDAIDHYAERGRKGFAYNQYGPGGVDSQWAPNINLYEGDIAGFNQTLVPGCFKEQVQPPLSPKKP